MPDIRRLIGLCILLASLVITLPANAVEWEPNTHQEQLCYGKAMLGLDSVINSRLGVPAEHALDLARVITTRHESYSSDLLKTILNAYLWQGSPHAYAVRVFYKCANLSKDPMNDADELIVEHERVISHKDPALGL